MHHADPGAKPRARRIWMPLPDHDFDPTEVAVAWKVLTRRGHAVTFATEAGATPAADPLMLTGALFGKLGAEAEPLAFYREMVASPAYQAAVPWSTLDLAGCDGLWLAGGHAKGMRPYLDSETLRAAVVAFSTLQRPVAAICHGVLVLARATDPATGRSILHGRRTTCLPKYMERTAYLLTGWKLGDYYRTYPAYVEDEVRSALASPDDFERGPFTLVGKGTDEDDRHAFVVEHAGIEGRGPYLSARWPGDAYALAKRFTASLERHERAAAP